MPGLVAAEEDVVVARTRALAGTTAPFHVRFQDVSTGPAHFYCVFAACEHNETLTALRAAAIESLGPLADPSQTGPYRPQHSFL